MAPPVTVQAHQRRAGPHCARHHGSEQGSAVTHVAVQIDSAFLLILGRTSNAVRCTWNEETRAVRAVRAVTDPTVLCDHFTSILDGDAARLGAVFRVRGHRTSRWAHTDEWGTG